MIAREAPDSVHLITQPDHARLARNIMERCVHLDRHPRREAILHAVAEHDSGWAVPDAAPTIDPATGGIADFVRVPVYVRQETSIVGIELLADSAWAAALVAQHRLEVYSRFMGDPEWRSFFAEVEELREEHLIASGGTLAELVDDYLFVRLGDLISLAFCTGWTKEERCRDYAVQLHGQRVVVTPDLFGGATIPLEIAARQLPHRPYQSDADLRRTFETAPVVVLRGETSAM